LFNSSSNNNNNNNNSNNISLGVVSGGPGSAGGGNVFLLLLIIFQILLLVVSYFNFYARLQNREKRVLASSCLAVYLHVCLSDRMEQLGSHWTEFYEF
jgi:hypothetical protein